MKSNGVETKEVLQALRRRSKASSKAKWQSMLYWFWGCVALLLVLVAMVAQYMRPDIRPEDLAVNDPALISYINGKRTSYRAASVSNFENWTLGDAKKSLGGVFWTQGLSRAPLCNPQLLGFEVPPDTFDLREQWSQCFTEPYPSYNCSSSWAVATATMLSNRLCMLDPKTYSGIRLSPQDLLSCDEMDSGCAGGSIDTVMHHLMKEGIVTETCFPFRGKSPPAVRCNAKCIAEEPVKISGFCRLPNEITAQREIMTNGPLIGVASLVDDFLVYGGGVYNRLKTTKKLLDTDRRLLTHAVKIIGWGVEGVVPYWLIENNFGKDWGEGGFGRIPRGDSQMIFEDVIITAAPLLRGREAEQQQVDEATDSQPQPSSESHEDEVNDDVTVVGD